MRRQDHGQDHTERQEVTKQAGSFISIPKAIHIICVLYVKQFVLRVLRYIPSTYKENAIFTESFCEIYVVFEEIYNVEIFWTRS